MFCRESCNWPRNDADPSSGVAAGVWNANVCSRVVEVPANISSGVSSERTDATCGGSGIWELVVRDVRKLLKKKKN